MTTVPTSYIVRIAVPRRTAGAAWTVADKKEKKRADIHRGSHRLSVSPKTISAGQSVRIPDRTGIIKQKHPVLVVYYWEKLFSVLK